MSFRIWHAKKIISKYFFTVYYFKAEDKYTVVRTLNGESLIKKSISQLSDELDPDHF